VPSRRPSPEGVLAALAAQLAELGDPPSAGLDRGPLGLAELQSACVDAALAAIGAGLCPQPGALRVAVRYLLDLLAGAAPGRAVEVRVPPYGAVQCMPGPVHTRGTPPNVVETDPVTWLRLATGDLTWQEGVEGGAIRASGPRADVSSHLPVRR